MSHLSRTLEPAPTDPLQEAIEYHAMDHRAVNRAFVDELLAAGPLGPESDTLFLEDNNPGAEGNHSCYRVIDLGCGPAAILIELCQRVPEVIGMGIDAEIGMLDLARQEIDFAGLLDRITLQHADATTMDDFEDGMADCVISNSLIHHLDEPEAGLRCCVRLLAEGGRLFVRDLLRPPSSEVVESLVQEYTGDENEHAQQLFRQSLHAALSLDEIRQLAGGLGIGQQHVQMSSDRHWTIDWRR